MKLKEIKDNIARKHHFQDWEEMLYIYRNTGEIDLDSLISEVVSAVLLLAADKAEIEFEDWGYMDIYINPDCAVVDKESILNCVQYDE